MLPSGRLNTGSSGEDAAAAFLQRQGLRVLQRNWRSQGYELDIICEDASLEPATLVFVEVRTRDHMGRATPAQSVDRAKRAKLSKAASLYLSAHDLWNRACRFDLVSVIRRDNDYDVEHIADAFEFAGSHGGGDAPWQPW